MLVLLSSFTDPDKLPTSAGELAQKLEATMKNIEHLHEEFQKMDQIWIQNRVQENQLDKDSVLVIKASEDFEALSKQYRSYKSASGSRRDSVLKQLMIKEGLTELWEELIKATRECAYFFYNASRGKQQYDRFQAREILSSLYFCLNKLHNIYSEQDALEQEAIKRMNG